MDRNIVEAIERLEKALASMGVSVKRFIMFGSAARGRRHPDSDIDVAAISDDFGKMNLYERLTTCGRALVQADICLPLEVLPFTEQEYNTASPGSFLNDEVKREGIEVK